MTVPVFHSRLCNIHFTNPDYVLSALVSSGQLRCPRMRPSADSQNSKGAAHDLQGKKNKNARVEAGGPMIDRHHEDVVCRRMQEVLVKIGTHGGHKENQRDQATQLVGQLPQRNGYEKVTRTD